MPIAAVPGHHVLFTPRVLSASRALHANPRRGEERRGGYPGSQSRALSAGGCRRQRDAESGCQCLARTHTHTHTLGGSRELVTGAEQMQPGLLSLYQLLPELC